MRMRANKAVSRLPPNSKFLLTWTGSTAPQRDVTGSMGKMQRISRKRDGRRQMSHSSLRSFPDHFASMLPRVICKYKSAGCSLLNIVTASLAFVRLAWATTSPRGFFTWPIQIKHFSTVAEAGVLPGVAINYSMFYSFHRKDPWLKSVLGPFWVFQLVFLLAVVSSYVWVIPYAGLQR